MMASRIGFFGRATEGAVMRRSLAALGLIGLLSPASAADLPLLRGSETFVPAFPAYARWEGFYFGGQLSYGNFNADFAGASQPLFAVPLRNLVFENEVHPENIPVLGAAERGAGGVGGFVGYNWQYEQAIIGLEFNYIHSDFNAGAPDFPIARQIRLSNGTVVQFTLDASATMRLTDIGELRARFGYAAGAFMPYATIGLASGRADVAALVSCVCIQLTPNKTPPPQFDPTQTVDFSFTNSTGKSSAYIWGYSGGGGLEWALTPNIFARADYEYIQWSPVSKITSHLNIAHLGLGLRF
jgi:outer membrane immunogenic protein